MRFYIGLMLIMLAGCQRSAPDETKQLASQSSKKDPPTTVQQAEPSPKKQESAATIQEVTLHVPDMAKRLDID
jgi:hypothetical protein